DYARAKERQRHCLQLLERAGQRINARVTIHLQIDEARRGDPTPVAWEAYCDNLAASDCDVTAHQCSSDNRASHTEPRRLFSAGTHASSRLRMRRGSLESGTQSSV